MGSAVTAFMKMEMRKIYVEIQYLRFKWFMLPMLRWWIARSLAIDRHYYWQSRIFIMKFTEPWTCIYDMPTKLPRPPRTIGFFVDSNWYRPQENLQTHVPIHRWYFLWPQTPSHRRCAHMVLPISSVRWTKDRRLTLGTTSSLFSIWWLATIQSEATGYGWVSARKT